MYDRFGMHEKEVKSLLKLPGVDYYPFTGKGPSYLFDTYISHILISFAQSII